MGLIAAITDVPKSATITRYWEDLHISKDCCILFGIQVFIKPSKKFREIKLLFHGERPEDGSNIIYEELEKHRRDDGIIMLDHTLRNLELRVNIGENLYRDEQGNTIIKEYKISEKGIEEDQIPLEIIDSDNTNISMNFDNNNELCILELKRDFKVGKTYALRLAFTTCAPKRPFLFKLRPKFKMQIHINTVRTIEKRDSIISTYLNNKEKVVPINLRRTQDIGGDLLEYSTCQVFVYTPKSWEKKKVKGPDTISYLYDEVPYEPHPLKEPLVGYKWDLNDFPYYKSNKTIDVFSEDPPIEIEFQKYDFNKAIVSVIIFFSLASFLRSIVNVTLSLSLFIAILGSLGLFMFLTNTPQIS